ncbi:hypothetical protein BY996DRAFT_4223960 [Phakopsora pachyrhizi]|nr:hypothetical protein BY996DRAFT_4223960 [Phakopsora pachyrhizi]
MGYTRVLIFLIIFQVFYLALGDSFDKNIYTRQNSLSTCARDCYTNATANTGALGTCSQTDNLCLCRRDEFGDSVKDCWDKCTDIEEAAAKTWFETLDLMI